ncbi:MAG: ADP-ribosylglycohydrolase family protein [Candidatus Doudnabacteria bacterium]|nr:ADP-ribosylglycohydrolase family protein [Candidatus Doudnabacteria bacterium]
MISLREKIIGMFLGIGIGDALGMPVETMSAEEIRTRFGRVRSFMEMPIDHKWHHDTPAGCPTDDTYLTLAVARAFIKSNGKFDMDAIAAEHVYELGLDSQTWGPSTRNAVKRLAAGVHWSESGKTDKPNSGMGNGVVMKLAPLAAYDLSRGGNQIREHELAEFTRLTHCTNEAVISTFVHFAVLRHLLKLNPDQIETWLLFHAIGGAFNAAFLYLRDEEGAAIELPMLDKLSDCFKQLAVHKSLTDEIILSAWPNTFLVHDTLGLSYACFLRKVNIESLYDAINLGGDTDSTGAIVGGMLGALYGPKFFPDSLMNGLRPYIRDMIEQVANQFCDSLEIEKEEI